MTRIIIQLKDDEDASYATRRVATLLEEGNKSGFDPEWDTFEDSNWLIWSNQHVGWLAPNREDHVRNRAKAGRYSYQEALKIVERANNELNDFPEAAMIEEQPGEAKK